LYFSTDHEQIWLRADQEPAEPVKHTIQDKRIIVTIAWNSLGFHLIEALPKGRRFNAEYYRDNIPTELIQFRPQTGERYVVIHAGNAPPYCAKKSHFCGGNEVPPTTHPPDSPDLVPSNLCLFGYVKHRLKGIAFTSGEESLAGMCEVLAQIPLVTLACVFEHWMERLEWISQDNGNYNA
jgi:hypothetical protein